MKIGKVPSDVLERLVIKPIENSRLERSEVLVKPSIGEDCTALDLGEEYCVLSTDPITGAVGNIGRLAININANDIASSGGRVIGIMVTILLPPRTKEKELEILLKDIMMRLKRMVLLC